MASHSHTELSIISTSIIPCDQSEVASNINSPNDDKKLSATVDQTVTGGQSEQETSSINVILRGADPFAASSLVKKKPQPPPIAPKPTKPVDVIPKGKVKAMSRDLEQRLTLTTERDTSRMLVRKEENSDKVELDCSEYEIVQGPPSRTIIDKLSLVDSHLEMTQNVHNDTEPTEGEYDPIYDDDFADFDITEDITVRSNVQSLSDDDSAFYATNVELLRPWLMPGYPTRQQAANSLKGEKDGAFVIRNRTGPDAHIFPYALTFIYNSRPIHLQIQRTENGGLVLAPWMSGEKTFSTLDELIEFYMDNRMGFVYKNVQGFVSLQKSNSLNLQD